MNVYPKVTIFCSSFNHEEYVKEALQSMLAQTYPNIEIIVIDDFSSDLTPEIVKSYAEKYSNIKFVMGTENLGVGARWNQMLGMLSGEYLACIGSDDKLQPDAIETRVKYMLEHPEIDLLLTEFDLLSGNKLLRGKEKLSVVPFFQPMYEIDKVTELYNKLLDGNFIQIGAGLIKLSSYEPEAKLLDERYYYLQDYDHLLKLILNHKVAFINESTYIYRWHEKNCSSGKNPRRNEFDAAAEKLTILAGQLMRKQNPAERKNTFDALNMTFQRLKDLSATDYNRNFILNNIAPEGMTSLNKMDTPAPKTYQQLDQGVDDEHKLEFTGERFVPGIEGQIAYEHLHRYAFASELSKEKTVLDIACGEGYGSELLSRGAREVVGVDISPEAVEHAKLKYGRKENLTFKQGECKKIPCPDKYFDIVVSYETLEHIVEQGVFMSEIKRVLKPDGLLIISTPNKKIYSDDRDFDNPYHLLELNEDEFIDLLKSNFRTARLWGQRLSLSSNLWPINSGDNFNFRHYQSASTSSFVVSNKPPFEAEYLIAICSDLSELPENYISLYTASDNNLFTEYQKKIERSNFLEKEISLRYKQNDELRDQINLVKKQNGEFIDLLYRTMPKDSPGNNENPDTALQIFKQIWEQIYRDDLFYAESLLNELIIRLPGDKTALELMKILNNRRTDKKVESGWSRVYSEQLLLEAERHIEASNLKEAEDFLISILNLDPLHIDAYNDLVVVNILAGNYKYAFDLISKVLNIEPGNEVAIGNMNYLKLKLTSN